MTALLVAIFPAPFPNFGADWKLSERQKKREVNWYTQHTAPADHKTQFLRKQASLQVNTDVPKAHWVTEGEHLKSQIQVSKGENPNSGAPQGPISTMARGWERRARGYLNSILHTPSRDSSNYTLWPAPNPLLQENWVSPSPSQVQNLPTALWSTVLSPGTLWACSYPFKTFPEKPLRLKH